VPADQAPRRLRPNLNRSLSGLIKEPVLVLNGAAQIGFQLRRLSALASNQRYKIDSCSLLFLGPYRAAAAFFQYSGRVPSIVREDGNPDAGCYNNLLAVEVERGLKASAMTRAEFDQFFGVLG